MLYRPFLNDKRFFPLNFVKNYYNDYCKSNPLERINIIKNEGDTTCWIIHRFLIP